MPDERVHAFINDLGRPIGTHLYGRRMYETMVFWETASTEPDEPGSIWDYAALWRAAEKIVYARTLRTVSSREDADRARVRSRRRRGTQPVLGCRHRSWGCRGRWPRNRRRGCPLECVSRIGFEHVEPSIRNPASPPVVHSFDVVPVGPVPRGCSSRTRSRGRGPVWITTAIAWVAG
jgi:hypothetical protein